jgi:hypothetical protein
MASIVLGAAGAAVGAGLPGVGPVVGGVLGRALGGAVGGLVDDALFGVPNSYREGARLADLSVQVSTYGKAIPALYGTARMAGNIIWSRPIEETATTTTSRSGGGKGGGGGARSSSTTYSYSVSLAIAICEGPIDKLVRVWADAQQLNLAQGAFRIYKGDEVQLPDSFIESFEGAGRTPAYRGLAYVVIEHFPLADYGNRIPNFTFEIKKKTVIAEVVGEPVESQIKSMIMIPGSGEFVYDTSIQQKLSGEAAGEAWAQSGLAVPINQHTPEGKANALVSLDDLAETCPNVEWVGVVVTWFGTSLSAAACDVLPGVEYAAGAQTQPEQWSVGAYTRGTAWAITLEDGSPRYGGTPDDQSLLRYLDALKARGYKVMLLPMFFMDVAGKPWRGRVTGSAAEVESFFIKTNGYNAFIMHYANLVAGRVDAFALGSELVGLTKVMGAAGVFPAVNQLVSLAAGVRGILGAGVKLTYAADWSEYHHNEGGWYNLDPLWASPNIDVIGIDAYFPLTDEPQSALTLEKIKMGWTSGEGYDWYYSDAARTVKAPLSPAYAWKNINWFWSNPHVNPNGATTAWVPGSKKIWFTEYGFPSVDGATNQPNVFYDPASSEGGFPRFSRGQIDMRAQRLGIAATEEVWGTSSMVERRFLWTWDARPYPYFPDLREVWSDGGVWMTGHWVTGKLGLSSLGAIVKALCAKAGLEAAHIDVSGLTQRVEGYVVTRQATARHLIEELMGAFFFDAVESGGVLRFVPRGEGSSIVLEPDALVTDAGGAALLTLTRQQELELPKSVSVLHLSRTAHYQTGTQSAYRHTSVSRDAETLSLPLVMADAQARAVAEAHLALRWMGRERMQFLLDSRYAALEPTDLVTLSQNGVSYYLRITRTLRDQGRLRVEAMAEDASLYQSYAPPIEGTGLATASAPLPLSRLELLDLPAFPGDAPEDATLRYAATGLSAGWRGAVIYRSDDGGANYGRLATLEGAAVIGTAVTALEASSAGNRFDEAASVTVRLIGEAGLESVTRLAVLNGANAALLGDEILQFREAQEVEQGKYVLRGLLRGRLGTEGAMATHLAGERFILMDGRVESDSVSPNMLGLPRLYKPVTVGGTLGSTAAQSFALAGRSLRPLPPVLLRGVRDSNGHIAISWVRRARVDHGWRDYVDVPLDEAVEQYRFEVLSSAAVVRSVLVATREYLYTASQQIEDFGSVQASINVQVRQISGRIGPGEAAMATL